MPNLRGQAATARILFTSGWDLALDAPHKDLSLWVKVSTSNRVRRMRNQTEPWGCTLHHGFILGSIVKCGFSQTAAWVAHKGVCERAAGLPVTKPRGQDHCLQETRRWFPRMSLSWSPESLWIGATQEELRLHMEFRFLTSRMIIK